MPTSYADQLASVQATIAKIEKSGQSYEIGTDGSSRRMVRGDLATLYEREKYLRGMAKREASGRSGIGRTKVIVR